nr:hypothetical protein A5482_15030 [Cyanobacterium sp. IPPAS B-1200]
MVAQLKTEAQNLYDIDYNLWVLETVKKLENRDLPQKKPRGGELTVEQKEENRELSRERVGCENAFAGVKRYYAVSSVYRNRMPEFDDKLMVTACGLWNLYLEVA